MKDWALFHSKKRFRPLVADSDFLWCYSAGYLCKVSYELNFLERVVAFPVETVLDRLGRSFRLIERIFRLAPSNGVRLGSRLYFSRRSVIYAYDLQTDQLSIDFLIPDGRRVLQMGLVSDVNGVKRVVFGEYFHNQTRMPVRIWGRSNSTNKWELLNTFSNGEIEHIHCVIEIEDKIFVLCGDFDHCASIWQTDRKFSVLQPILRGKQSHRAAWIEKIGGRFVFATDSQVEKNNLRELVLDDRGFFSNELQDIEGSSIYAGKGFGNLFFSTTVEGGVPTGNLLLDSLDCRRGGGIASRFAKIYSLDSEMKCDEIFSAKKDFWPFRLGQFGTFTFPTGVQPYGIMVCYATALVGMDDMCLVFRKIPQHDNV